MKGCTLFTNVPAPYRDSFLRVLSQYLPVHVVYEAERIDQVNAKWYARGHRSEFQVSFLKEGRIHEKFVNFRILGYLLKARNSRIIFTNWGSATQLFALLLAALFRLEYVLLLDGVLPGSVGRFQRLKRIIVRRARVVFSPNRFTDRFLLDLGCSATGIVRYPFTSLWAADILGTTPSPSVKKEMRKSLGLPEMRTIIFVGQFIHRKGVDILLESKAFLKGKYHFVLVGGLPPQQYLDIIRKNGLDEVTFVPFQSKESLAQYYTASDLFVLPTREDIWGLVINEAMAHGLPIVTTKNCGAADVLVESGFNGYLVDEFSPQKLADSIQSVFDVEEKKTSFAQSSLVRIQHYSVEEMAKTIAKGITG